MKGGKPSLGHAVSSRGIEWVLLSGDREPGAENVARETVLSNWRRESMKRHIRIDVMLRE